MNCISYVFIRHAQAIKSEDEKSSSLSELGKQHARKRGEYFNNEDPFDLVIVSSALRTKETAKEILEQLNYNPPIIELDKLYLPVDALGKQEINALLGKLGAKNLNIYMQHDLKDAWKKYAQQAFEAIMKIVKKYKSKKALIVGHGNVINSIGLIIAPAAHELYNIYFNCCEGFEINDGKLARLIR